MFSVLHPLILPSIDKAAPVTRRRGEEDDSEAELWQETGLPCNHESAEHWGPIWEMNQHFQELTLAWIPEGLRNQGNASD